MKNTSYKSMFVKYVSQNILGMIGMSAYILADTFFISVAEGADGITALNLVLPIYSVIFAIGAMTGVGSAIRFKILRARGDAEADKYFSNSIMFGLILGAVFVLAGAFIPDKLVALLGGDSNIVEVGTSYTRIFMMFAPFFMWNYICNAFVRNDGAPLVAMAATLCSSIFNIVIDYVLMFPLNLGMAGAALATALSPVMGVVICCTHLLSKKNTVRFKWSMPSVRKLLLSWQLGISAFVGELSSGVTTVVFNMLILGLVGNTGVAAYGVVANTSLVAVSIFNGISQGAQPLLSEYYGKGNKRVVKSLIGLSVVTSFVLAFAVVALIFIFAAPITAVFNSENDTQLAKYAVEGLRLYFIGFLFAGFNIVGTGILSAIESSKWAFLASISRGFVAIVICAFVMSAIFGMTGVWLAFCMSELITAVLVFIALKRNGG